MLRNTLQLDGAVVAADDLCEWL